MTIATNTFLTYSAKGIREDLSNQIYNISPETTPFMNNIGRGTASNTLFQWQTDTLADNTTANAQLQGDDISTYDAVTPTVQLTNYTQISRKTVVISGTVEAVNKAGRKSELAYQLAKRAAELKRDMETIMLANQAATAGNSTTAPKTGSLLAFIKTNTDKGTNVPILLTQHYQTQRVLMVLYVHSLKPFSRMCFRKCGNKAAILRL